MNKTILYFKFSYKFFIVVFLATTLPFYLLRLSGFNLTELPFMFLVLLGLTKFFLAKSQDTAAVRKAVKAKMNANLSKQELVDLSATYTTAQDISLLINAVAIFIINIVLGA
ncbi:MAG: hypothetical protein CME64_17405 [Halobacteriovoraceae bacterium]|nr:hypothetical protein [Halobacteriovoraceae bacterium]|tara:strand:- start:317709 stop:318044 length:336 start_codon:yes stop_codon:yes gene_type:complete